MEVKIHNKYTYVICISLNHILT